MAPKFKFQENEKVLCFHGPLLYEAKCMKAQIRDKTLKYFVHYSGWNNKWDEWVPENRVLKVNEVNLQKQADLQAAQQKAKKEGKKKKDAEKKEATTPKAEVKKETPAKEDPKKETKETKEKSTPTGGKKREPPSTSGKEKVSTIVAEDPKKKKPKTEPAVESEYHYTQKNEMKIKIPDDLKNRLADDWDFINRQKKLLKLPCGYTVEKILQEYLTQRISVKGTTLSKESAVTEFTGGIRDYFNAMLGKHLLYKFERPQYAEILEEHKDKQMSEIYGAIHLLRMFTLLGRFLSFTPLDEKNIQLLLLHLHDILRFIYRNVHYCSMCEYVIAPPDYHRRAM